MTGPTGVKTAAPVASSLWPAPRAGPMALTGMDCGPEAVLRHVSVTAMTDWIACADHPEFRTPDIPKKRQDRSASAKLIQHGPRLPQISGIESFRESAIDRCQQISRSATLIPAGQQACERRGGAQFKQTRRLAT